MNREFRNAIESISESYGIKKGEIANRLGVTQSYLSRLITGMQMPSDSIKSKINQVFPEVKIGWESDNLVEDAIVSYMRANLYTVDDLASIIGTNGLEVTETLATGFTEETAQKWSDALGFDKYFLLTGKGQLIPDRDKRVPLVPITAQAGRLGNFTSSVSEYECEKIISPIKDAELAVPIIGESMSPELPSGAIVFVKKINERAFIEWGKPYVLDTINGPIIKFLAPGSNESSVKCISANKDPMYAPFEVQYSDIYGIYRVINMMCNK